MDIKKLNSLTTDIFVHWNDFFEKLPTRENTKNSEICFELTHHAKKSMIQRNIIVSQIKSVLKNKDQLDIKDIQKTTQYNNYKFRMYGYDTDGKKIVLVIVFNKLKNFKGYGIKIVTCYYPNKKNETPKSMLRSG